MANDADTENRDGLSLGRRRVMQAVGAAGAAGLATQSAAGDSDGDGVQEILAPDVGGLSYWEYMTFCCLEGLANRDGPEVLFYYPEKSEESWYDTYPVPDERVFYQWYKDYSNVEFTEFDDPYELFDRLDPLPFDGYVVVDETAPVTVNVAANYAGSDDLLPVTSSTLDDSRLPDREVVYDLRETHRGANFDEMSHVEAYEWAFEHQWPDSNHARLCNLGTPDGGKPDVDISAYTRDSDTIYLKFADADPSDGAGTQLHLARVRRDGEAVAEVVPTTDHEQEVLVAEEGTSTDAGRQIRWCGGSGEHWVYELSGVQGASDLELELRNQYLVSVSTSLDGPYDELVSNLSKFGPVDKYGLSNPPANFFYTSNRARDFTVAENGFFVDLASDPNVTDSKGNSERELKDRILSETESMALVFGWHTVEGSEGQHIGHLSEHGLLAIGASTYAANFSLHQQIEPPGDAVARFRNRARKPVTTENVDDKIYLTFHLSDGDSLNFLMRRAQGGQWLLDERGDVPFGWEMAPLLADLGPGILDYFQATATDNDSFVGGPSGIGYFYPDFVPDDEVDDLLDATREGFERTGLEATTVMRGDSETPTNFHEHVGDAITGAMEGYVRSGTDEHLFGEYERAGDGAGRLPIDARESTAYLPTALPSGHDARGSVDDLYYPLADLAETRSGRPLFVPVHVTAHSLTIADVVKLVDRLDENYSGTFEAVLPEAFFTLFGTARPGSVVFEPPESVAPDDLTLVTGVPNRLTPTLQAFGDDPVDVDVTATLSAPNLDGERQVGSVSTTIDGGTTTTVDAVVDLPEASGEGTVEFTVDDGDPSTVTLPATFLQWPEGVAKPESVSNPSTYEAEAANHNLGHRVEDPAALNGVAWQATYDPDSFDDTGNDHMVWYPSNGEDRAGEFVALYRMKVANNTIDESVATIDVVENIPFGDPEFFYQGSFKSKDIEATEFDAAGEYQWFAMRFEKPVYEDKASSIDDYLDRVQTQYRVDYDGHTAVTVDRVFVVQTE